MISPNATESLRARPATLPSARPFIPQQLTTQRTAVLAIKKQCKAALTAGERNVFHQFTCNLSLPKTFAQGNDRDKNPPTSMCVDMSTLWASARPKQSELSAGLGRAEPPRQARSAAVMRSRVVSPGNCLESFLLRLCGRVRGNVLHSSYDSHQPRT
jgi:hypothetical protein